MVKRALLAVFLATAGISLAHAETLVQTEPLSVPAGTMLHCRTTQTLTTKLNFQGDAFTISVAEPVTINGRVAIPVGSTLAGRITRMERPGRIKGVGQMRLTVEQITLPDGRSFPLGATLMTAYGADNVKVVGSEGLVKGPSSRVPDFEEIGAGTAGGTLLGLIFAHPVIGATVGLTAHHRRSHAPPREGFDHPGRNAAQLSIDARVGDHAATLRGPAPQIRCTAPASESLRQLRCPPGLGGRCVSRGHDPGDAAPPPLAEDHLRLRDEVLACPHPRRRIPGNGHVHRSGDFTSRYSSQS